MSKAISLTGLSEFLKKCKEIFVKKEEKYIIIDWAGKDSSDAAKKAEVDAQLKNIYLANPLALLSVVFLNYSSSLYVLTFTTFAPDDPMETTGIDMNYIAGSTVGTYSFEL